MVVALLLAYESRGLLVGEGADPETIQSIRELAENPTRPSSGSTRR